jgi:hypothetical protein
MSQSVRVPDELADRLAAEAARRGISVDELSAQLLSAGLGGTDALEEFIGSGHSGRGDLAGRHRQIAAEAFAGKTARQV